MKIAMLVPKFPTLSETFILNQITGLIDRGYDVDILTFNKGDTEILHNKIKEYNLMSRVFYLGGEIPHNKIKRVLKAFSILFKNELRIRDVLKSINFFKYGRDILSLRCFYTLANLRETKNYDIIHSQYGTQGIEAMVLQELGLLNGKIVTSLRGFDITRAWRTNVNGYKRLFLKGNIFLPVCNHFKKILINRGCPENKIYVHYSGIDTKLFVPKKEKRPYFHIISTARLEAKKGLEYSIKAVSDLILDGRNIRYTIIGDGSLKEKLNSQIQSLGMEKHINLVGRKNHSKLVEFLNSADLFLAPSITTNDGNQEGIPNAIKEAMLMKIPVIGSNHSGIPELVRNNETGYLVPEKDSYDMYKKIKKVMDNPEEQISIVEKAYEIVKTEFSMEKLNDELVKIYVEALESSIN